MNTENTTEASEPLTQSETVAPDRQQMFSTNEINSMIKDGIKNFLLDIREQAVKDRESAVMFDKLFTQYLNGGNNDS